MPETLASHVSYRSFFERDEKNPSVCIQRESSWTMALPDHKGPAVLSVSLEAARFLDEDVVMLSAGANGKRILEGAIEVCHPAALATVVTQLIEALHEIPALRAMLDEAAAAAPALQDRGHSHA